MDNLLEATAEPSPEPLRHEVVVTVTPAEAFDRFTARYGEWWDAACTPDPDTYEGMGLVPRVGGTVALRHGDTEHSIGEVTAWEPGAHFAQTFTLGLPAGTVTTLDVRFTQDAQGCRVVLEHGGWVPGTERARASIDWSHLLDRYAALG